MFQVALMPTFVKGPPSNCLLRASKFLDPPPLYAVSDKKPP